MIDADWNRLAQAGLFGTILFILCAFISELIAGYDQLQPA